MKAVDTQSSEWSASQRRPALIDELSDEVRAAELDGKLAIHHDRSPRLLHSVIGGTFWVFAAFAIGRALGFGENLILAKILDPSDFGIVGFAMILIGAFTILQDLGVPASVVYTERNIKEVGGTALVVNVAASAFLLLVTVALSPLFVRVTGENEIGPIVVALGAGLLLASVGSVHRALFVKNLAFRRKIIPDVVPLVGAAVVSIPLALNGAGAWSLVWGYLVEKALSSALAWRLSGTLIRPQFDFAIARELLAYGKHVSFVSVVGFVTINVDYFIVGYELGTFDLGIYTLAFTLANIPEYGIGTVIASVMFPAYVRIKSDIGKVAELFDGVFRVVTMMVTVVGISIFVCGPVLVRRVFGDEWSGIAEPLQILAVYGIVRSMPWGFGSLYKAVGVPMLEWQVTIARLLVLVPSMLILVKYGIVGIAWAQLLVAGLFIPVNCYILTHVLRRPRSWILGLIGPQVASVTAAALVIIVSQASPNLETWVNTTTGSILLAVAAIVAYLLMFAILQIRLLLLTLKAVRPQVRVLR